MLDHGTLPKWMKAKTNHPGFPPQRRRESIENPYHPGPVVFSEGTVCRCSRAVPEAFSWSCNILCNILEAR